MLQTSARLLKLLSLLEMRRDWSGDELAGRLDVTTRTVRRDVDKLRELGYPVHAMTGTAGGYRLGAGASMPPLLLDDDEAVAVAVGLGTAVSAGVSGMEETSVRALAKLEQILPPKLRTRVSGFRSHTVPVHIEGETVDPGTLTLLANACRDHDRLRFDYVSHDGTSTYRITEPHRLARAGRRWYLLAWDVDKQDWRLFRVDRIEPVTPTGPRFKPRDLPDDDMSAYIGRKVALGAYQIPFKVLMHLPAEKLRQRVPERWGTVTPVDENSCVLESRADNLEGTAAYLSTYGVEFEVLEPQELKDQLTAMAGRLLKAAGRPAA
ncbi:DNA-binding transcriptional regulator [Actinorhabdospora filicis]|uniref:DNA-binding transcriptional regulator n=1 Tax=Actinorhabdospora filicis TaxID=1785913 RepID=A0A9W6SSP0_9ACTN|nr:YafY family protein [Actinorhabdospora filicis]GLZ81122.1 DNA-binding transcriptional regulator [Actinorhabdospora filicis]